MSRFIALRHPRPAAAPGLCYGRLDLAPGPDAAAEIAAALAATPPAAAVVSSPARRARALADALAARDGLAVTVDARWQELDFGAWEGRPWTAIDRAESDPWAEDPVHRAPPGGERFADLAARVAAACAALAPGAVVVTHAGPIRALRMALGSVSFQAAFAEAVPYARPIAFARATEAPWPT